MFHPPHKWVSVSSFAIKKEFSGRLEALPPKIMPIYWYLILCISYHFLSFFFLKKILNIDVMKSIRSNYVVILLRTMLIHLSSLTLSQS